MLLVDTSVVLKWFWSVGEQEVAAARAILEAHRAGRARAVVLDLALYEVGNVLLRPLRQPAEVVRRDLALLLRLCGPVVRPRPSWYAEAADLGAQHGLTYYDASWAAAARALACPLVTADRALLAAGLGVSASEAAGALPPASTS